jgi:hypothetical protein
VLRYCPVGPRPVGHIESQTGPNAGIPRRSNPYTTSQVIFLLETQTPASAPDSR